MQTGRIFPGLHECADYYKFSEVAQAFLTYETEFVLFLAMLEFSVLPMSWYSSHNTVKVTSEF